MRKEMAFFTKMTSGVKDLNKKNAVIMGRRSWDCIPENYRPLVNRVNIVLTRNVQQIEQRVPQGVLVFSSLDEAVKYIESRDDIESTWVIGGSAIYKEAMDHEKCDKIYLTEIQNNFQCDTYFPSFDKQHYQLVEEDGIPTEAQVEGDIKYYFRIYKKV
ncbi:dihydrofolate reductase isoform X2 [Pectinophora gossypiella]|uniref:dihydrofolate reductase isoform X2 n=1 Tax=Pectinophora gossypiella TaxID=13191 RepID=UPI00214E507B|nr:dihydrofolate reductase isoform X2 [Pectinophora gossypiella]